ncbi:unnamed protein product [Rotaria magnacalcarata]|uniref:Uncharacterized protein n=1 Tax=Rotaria magnacalcarata TaxID=392030 RepID=A0A814ID82_9BILA|nr:unnamed protein product [Rotaria magnacalcarata]CAF1367795.1 unnamed protein product [Rotaria magnacalcarata]CAF2258520.1 unnamed protein product [Rotaria magnacalcarata]CAF3875283.1 unnamed protein product [Rotaria magnacalcarata]CAF3880766.1 unnamed protein product [Rotaria magnacalcarata]
MTRFASNVWLEAIDFSKLAIVGGCVLNALCRSPFPDTKNQDVNLVYYANDVFDFEKTIDSTIANLNKMGSRHLTNVIKVEKVPGASSYNVFLHCGIQLNISRPSIGESKNPLSHILHNFDMDICQVAFTGDKIVSTFPFLEALATKSFVVYTLHAQSPKHVCARIAKYCNRGFYHLEPIRFDGDFNSSMAQEEIPLYRVEHLQYIDDDGEIRHATKEFHRSLVDNIDTFRLQEKFMHMVCPQLLQYA